MHPDALRAAAEHAITGARMEERARAMDSTMASAARGASGVAGDSIMPAAVREWFAEQRRSVPSFYKQKYGVTSIAELEKLAPEEITRRWLANILGRNGLVAQRRVERTRTVVGQANEHDSIADVVFRQTVR